MLASLLEPDTGNHSLSIRPNDKDDEIFSDRPGQHEKALSVVLYALSVAMLVNTVWDRRSQTSKEASVTTKVTISGVR